MPMIESICKPPVAWVPVFPWNWHPSTTIATTEVLSRFPPTIWRPPMPPILLIKLEPETVTLVNTPTPLGWMNTPPTDEVMVATLLINLANKKQWWLCLRASLKSHRGGGRVKFSSSARKTGSTSVVGKGSIRDGELQSIGTNGSTLGSHIVGEGTATQCNHRWSSSLHDCTIRERNLLTNSKGTSSSGDRHVRIKNCVGNRDWTGIRSNYCTSSVASKQVRVVDESTVVDLNWG